MIRMVGSHIIIGPTGVLRLKAPTQGTVIAAGTDLRTSKTRGKEAGTIAVRVYLNAGAKARLQRRKTLHTKIHITFKPTNGEASAIAGTLTFKAPSHRKRR
jgi:hypothetical protein